MLTDHEAPPPRLHLLARLRRRLARALDPYDLGDEDGASAVFASQDPALLLDMMEGMRAEVARDGAHVLLRRRRDDYALYIVRAAEDSRERPLVALALLALTLATTTLAGAALVAGRHAAAPDHGALPAVEALARGLGSFALPLLFVLGVHAWAHRAAARRAGVRASLPYLVPLPMTFLGAGGVLVGLRDPLPTRRALVHAGAWGPLAGFLAATLVLAAGLSLSSAEALPDETGTLRVGRSILLAALGSALGLPSEASLHPMAVAGWVGLLLTSLSLLPLGTLEGGRLARGLLGARARWLAYAALAFLAGLGFLWWPWWVLVALLAPAALHPQPLDDVTPAGWRAWLLGLVALGALALSFAPVPLT